MYDAHNSFYMVLFLDEEDCEKELSGDGCDTMLDRFNSKIDDITQQSILNFEYTGDMAACISQIPGHYVEQVIQAFYSFEWSKSEYAALYVRQTSDHAGNMFYAAKETIFPRGSVTMDVPKFLLEHLRLWENSGEPGPMNELQSIAAWLSTLGHRGLEETRRIMQARMTLLTNAANALYDAGEEAEDKVGIYEKRSRADVNGNGDVKEDANNLQINSLYRKLAAAHLLAQQNGDRLDAKNRECNALREEIAKLNERLGRK